MTHTDQHIISIQSLVSTGYVGNNVAGLAIQLHGLNHVMVPTVLLSSHTDKPVYYGEVINVALFNKLLKGITEIEVAAQTRYVISGYIKEEALIQATAKFVQSIKANNAITYIYDPVFGDTRANGLYIPEGDVAHSIAYLLPLCDILTPNHFELEYILQQKINTKKELFKAVQNHPILAHKTIVLTTAELEENIEQCVEVVLLKDGEMTYFYAPNIPIEVVGTGDLFAGILSAQLTQGNSMAEAIQCAMLFISTVLEYVQQHKLTEMNAAALMHAYKTVSFAQK